MTGFCSLACAHILTSPGGKITISRCFCPSLKWRNNIPGHLSNNSVILSLSLMYPAMRLSREFETGSPCQLYQASSGQLGCHIDSLVSIPSGYSFSLAWVLLLLGMPRPQERMVYDGDSTSYSTEQNRTVVLLNSTSSL